MEQIKKPDYYSQQVAEAEQATIERFNRLTEKLRQQKAAALQTSSQDGTDTATMSNTDSRHD